MVGEENETFFIRARKPLPNRRVLKTWKPERENSNRTISASGGLGRLQMVLESDTGQMVLESDTGRCASEKAKPKEWWTRGDLSARMLGLEGVDWETHDWRGERVPERTLDSKGVDCEIPHWLEKRYAF